VSPGASRRAFLGGAAAMLALPWLPSLVRGARAEAPKPVRLLWWFCPNGMPMSAFTPSSTGTAWETTRILAPLAGLRDEVLVVSGLETPKDAQGRAPHANGTVGFLTGRVPQVDTVRAGVSVDQLAAARLGRLTPFPSLQLGLDGPRAAANCDAGYSCTYTQTLSWADERTPLPELVDPRLLFDRLFGGVDPTATAAERARRQALRTSILDVVRQDAARLVPRLGSEDRVRLDRYLTSVRELEERLVALGADPTCDAGADVELPPGDAEARADRFSELIALAFACDLTRVVTFALGNGGSVRGFDFLGVTGGHHELSHHGGDPAKIEAVTVIGTWEVERFAVLLRALQAHEEEGETLLDRTVCVLGSEVADGNTHDLTNLPIVVAGRGGGAIAPGRHVALPGRGLLDLHLTALAAAGVDVAPWGNGSGPIAELAG
jgi:hypothetical protein